MNSQAKKDIEHNQKIFKNLSHTLKNKKQSYYETLTKAWPRIKKEMEWNRKKISDEEELIALKYICKYKDNTRLNDEIIKHIKTLLLVNNKIEIDDIDILDSELLSLNGLIDKILNEYISYYVEDSNFRIAYKNDKYLVSYKANLYQPLETYTLHNIECVRLYKFKKKITSNEILKNAVMNNCVKNKIFEQILDHDSSTLYSVI